VALAVLEKKIFKDVASFSWFFTSCLENIWNFGTIRTNYKEANPGNIPAKN
jgi:hypothetical protein